MNPVTWPRRGLYLLTPDDPDTGRLLARLAPVLATRPALVQYRNKQADEPLRRAQAEAVLAACRAAGVPMARARARQGAVRGSLSEWLDICRKPDQLMKFHLNFHLD